MSDLQFKVIEQANEIADGDYLLTIHDGEIKKVAKADAKVGGDDGGAVIIPIYRFNDENDVLYKIQSINNNNYYVVKDSEWRKIKKGSPVIFNYTNSQSSDGYAPVINILITPGMFNMYYGDQTDYDGKNTTWASCTWISGTSLEASTYYIIPATALKKYIQYDGGKPPYEYEGDALSVLEELGYFDAE